MTDKEKAITWFENIAYECDKLTSGNVAHLRAQIKGMAIRSAEYLKKQEPASEDLEDVANEYGKDIFVNECMENGVCDNNDLADAFKAGAQWQREQMMKDAVEGKIVGGKSDLIHLKEGVSDYQSGDKVKVIIIKE